MVKKAAFRILGIISVIIIITCIGAIIEKIKWYSAPFPGLAEMINIKVCIIWLVIAAAVLFFTSLYPKKH